MPLTGIIGGQRPKEDVGEEERGEAWASSHLMALDPVMRTKRERIHLAKMPSLSGEILLDGIIEG